jgi:type IV fimbrial biogenesis protein FimT
MRPAPRSPSRRSAGFNMVELMIVVFIIAALAAIAAPNMGKMIRTQRIKTSAFDVLATITFARSESIKRNSIVTITPTGGDWAKGWIVKDANNNVLKEEGPHESVTIAGPASLAYASNGRLDGGGAPQFDISTTDVSAGSLRCIKVDGSGRPNTKEGAC